MKSFIVSSLIAGATLVSCSTVSSVLQNTLPFNASFTVSQSSSTDSELSAVGAGTSLNQIMGVSQNVNDIRANAAKISVVSGDQGMGVFKSVKVYVISGTNEILVASRDQIADNIGTSLSLDVSNRNLDAIMKSGGTIQQRIVYVLKSRPTSDLNMRSSITFSSVPVAN